jgi:transcription elongation factor GreA
MTPECYDRLKEELDWRKGFERPAISQQIETAREHGDLKENAEYHAAKDKQGLAEARIRQLEAKTVLAQVVDPMTLKGGRVSFGATVKVFDIDEDVEAVYKIVGDEESDFRHKLLSYMSPIARGLMGKEEGDEVQVAVADGKRKFEILEVEFKEIELVPRKTWG